jgi:hypothetical protein
MCSSGPFSALALAIVQSTPGHDRSDARAAAYLAVNRSLLKAIFQIRCEENVIDAQPVDSLNLQSEAIRAGSSHRS